MAIDFKLPNLGENVDSGDIVSVLVNEGDTISAEQGVFEVETGKAVVELPCPHAGRISKIHVQKGTKVKVGETLLTVENNGGAPAAAPAKAAAPAAAPATSKPAATNGSASQPTASQKPAPTAASGRMPAPTDKTPPAGPATRRLARQLGVDLVSVSGTGPGGRITEDDVRSAAQSGTTLAKAPEKSAKPAVVLPLGEGADSWGPIRRDQMPRIRKTIAINMAKSSNTIPHVTNFDDADVTDLENLRKNGLANFVDPTIKLTMMPFVIKAVATALKLHPTINCSIDVDAEQITYKDYVNIGIAVDTERGLVVPVIRDADKLSIPALAKQLMSIAEKARDGKLSLDEMRGGTFTISNLGAVGGTYSTPIINSPEVAILLTGRSRKLPVVMEDDSVKPRLMMPMSLSYDHRIIDGATAARFLNEVNGLLKMPGRMLLT
jgi:pyruvate dehydrogenase E2 component (dihydrolipoamide acetyltransferase)